MTTNDSIVNFESTISINSTVEILETDVIINNFVKFLRYLDGCIRVYAIVVYISYFIIIIFKKEFRVLSFTYVHNVNINGFIFVLHYGFYLISPRPNTSNQILNEILCRLSEIIWGSSKYLNTFSVLLLAYSRFIAVCRIDLYKRVIKSKFNVFSSIIILWLFSISIAITSKFVFKTRPDGALFCFDGYSENILHSVSYFIFIAITAIIMPNCFVLYLYAKLLHKLNELSKIVGNKSSRRKLLDKWSYALEQSKGAKNLGTRYISENKGNRKLNSNQKLILNDTNKENSGMSVSKTENNEIDKIQILKTREPFGREQFDGSIKLAYKRKNEYNQKTQAKQLIILSITIGFTTITFLLLNAGNLLDPNQRTWKFFRLIIRIITIFLQSLIPIISIIFHPIMSKSLKKIAICNNTNSSNNNKVGIELTTLKD
jgi:hypothetical protein